jgi:cytochrome c oxidase assembly protein subunit 11
MSLTAPSERQDPDRPRNRRVAAICAVVFFAMVGAAYAAVPLYKAFCQLTGFDGTVRRAQLAPDKVLERKLLIRFDVNVRNLPWTFTAEQASQNLKIGETGLAFFKVTNNSDKPMTGQATYGVIPEQVGPYFQKLQCFCFSQQTIGPRQTVEFPVVYFVDPKFADDSEAKGAHEVTLSYTFFPAVLPAKPQVEAKASPIQTSQALGGTARAGL